MKVLILNDRKLDVLELPKNIEGSFWITDDKNDNLIAVEALQNQWVFVSNQNYSIMNGKEAVSSLPLSVHTFYTLKSKTGLKTLYTMDDCDFSFKLYKIQDMNAIHIGLKDNNEIIYAEPLIQDQQIVLNYNQEKWSIHKSKEEWLYINQTRNYEEETFLKNGDEVFWYGLRFTVFQNYLLLNQRLELVKINSKSFIPIQFQIQNKEYEPVDEVPLYKEDDYYVKAPRLRRFITTYEITISAPPSMDEPEETPAILMFGPMVTMGMSSSVSFINVFLRISSGQATWANSWPTLVVAVAMLTSTFLWPNLTRKWQKKQRIKKNKERYQKYMAYLDKKWKLLEQEMVHQQQILKENLLSLQECYQIIMQKQRILWERKISQKDFLTVRLGIGDVLLDANINFNEEDFVLEEDELKDAASKTVNRSKVLKDMPVGYSFFNKNVTAIIGQENCLSPLVRNIFLQLMAYHSYDEVKFVVFTNSQNEENWSFLKLLPHTFSDEKDIRFFATTQDERDTISEYLSQIYIDRANEQVTIEKEEDENEKESDETYSPYYLIFTDDFPSIRKLGIIELLLSHSEHFGFSLLVRENRLRKIPSECDNFINVTSEKSAILSLSPEDYSQVDFVSEIDDSFPMNECARVLSNTPIALDFDRRFLPDSISFLEMYHVGKIEQLNVLNRWRLNDPTKTLRAIVGVNDLDEPIYLDLHEKKHGPHGLIAGTTGSGKSEFIITYILSLALNYSPNEVAFILIDYKGGGLAGAFENEKNGIHLPHLAGTITNLDKNELNRTLVSIDSELKRRQQIFNQAREKLGESTMDIYKYQKFFRENKLEEPLPHLFIICDEFAELKAQQPDFMNNLISTARIGRSLGAHLILATQKPSGVVNDQIWSNSKFKVCLKVQDVSDSNEVLKKPDAAALKNAGRFYLQVGSNEVYILGQSGWAGANYIAKDVAKQEYDRSIDFVDNTLAIYKNVENDSEKKMIHSSGDELTNILKYITSLAERENVYAEPLWCDIMPGIIYLHDLISKYHVTKNPNCVESIVGEYDDPNNQKQGLLTLPLDEDGNSLIYGISGIGREMFLRSVIFSASSIYSTLDINFYVLDFGSEALRVFEALPHVADIAFNGEDEKVMKLFAFIQNEMEMRKQLFADFNGDYQTYIKSSETKLPMICLVINNFDSFRESFSGLEETLIRISREGKRYGIILLITLNSAVGLMSRFTRNFNHTFVLDMNDKNDYLNILGKIGDVYPSNFDGRGLYKTDIAYEFQTATLCDSEEMLSYVQNAAKELRQKNSYIPKKIPVLREHVTVSSLISDIKDLKTLPIGIEKISLETGKLNLKSQKITVITGNDLEAMIPFTYSILSELPYINRLSSIVIDMDQMLSKENLKVQGYCDHDATAFINTLKNYIENKIVGTNFELLISIVGLERFISSVDMNLWKEFLQYVNHIDNVSVLFIESSFKIKAYVFEPWYSSMVVNMNGLWIGSGLMDQSIVKVTDMDKKYREKIGYDYGWVIKNGEGTLVKLVSLEGEENEK